MFKPLPICFLLLVSSFLFLHSCKKDDEIIEYHVMDFDVVNNEVDVDAIKWYDDLHAMRLRYDLLSFTSDGGVTWSTEWTPSGNRDVIAMVYPQVDTAYVFMQDVSDVDVYRTENRGGAWTLLYTFQTGTNTIVGASARTGKKIFCITEGSNGYKVFRTLNAGTTWPAINSCNPLFDLHAVTDSLFFAVSSSRDLYRSTLAGSNFTNVTGTIDVSKYVILPSVQKGFLVDLYGRIYASHDYGITWNNVLDDPAGASVAVIDAHPSGLVFAAGSGAPLVSRDFGATWDYFHLEGVVDEVDYRYRFVRIIDQSTVVCGIFDPNDRDDKIIKCHLP